MKPAARQALNADFLSAPFVAIPYEFLQGYANLGIHAHEMVLLVQIISCGQVRGTTELSPQELGDLCGMSSKEVLLAVERLVREGILAIGERFDESGAHVTYFDLQPLWTKLRGKPDVASEPRMFRQDPLSLFEAEFGRPLSAVECDQLRTWMGSEGYPEWMVVEALKESVLAGKYSFRYIDRVLFDWQRHKITSRESLEAYRHAYRERIRDSETRQRTGFNGTQTNSTRTKRPSKDGSEKEPPRDERYSNFYQLFPDS